MWEKKERHFLVCKLAFPSSNSMFWGSQAEEELQKYLKTKEQLSNTILQTDQALTAKEIARKGEKEMGAMHGAQDVES